MSLKVVTSATEKRIVSMDMNQYITCRAHFKNCCEIVLNEHKLHTHLLLSVQCGSRVGSNMDSQNQQVVILNTL